MNGERGKWEEAWQAYGFARYDLESLDDDCEDTLLNFRSGVLTDATDRLLMQPAPDTAALVQKLAIYLVEDVADATDERRQPIHDTLMQDCRCFGISSYCFSSRQFRVDKASSA